MAKGFGEASLDKQKRSKSSLSTLLVPVVLMVLRSAKLALRDRCSFCPFTFLSYS